MKYTPGPWFAEADGVYSNKQRTEWKSSTIIALMWDYTDESLTNARLISAAPEMFELLEDFEAIIDTALHNGHHDLAARLKSLLKKVRDG